MSRRTVGSILAGVGLATLLQFFGCLQTGVTRRLVIDSVTQGALEFLFDNDAVLDLFPD